MYVIAVIVAGAWAVATAVYYVTRGIGFVIVMLCRAIGARSNRSAPDAESLRRSLYQADAEVGAAARLARREMNTAAGQSWRDLAG